MSNAHYPVGGSKDDFLLFGFLLIIILSCFGFMIFEMKSTWRRLEKIEQALNSVVEAGERYGIQIEWIPIPLKQK